MIRIAAVPVLCSLLAAQAAAQVQPLDSTAERRLLQLARRIEPQLEGQSERLALYVDLYRNAFANDTRLFAFDVHAEALTSDRVRLGGYAEFPEACRGIVRFFERLGFDVEDAIQQLPADDLGAHRFGCIQTPHALSYNRPREPRSVVTDCLLGEPVYLLREQEGHYLIHSREGYLGYVATADVLPQTETEFTDWIQAEGISLTRDYSASNDWVLPAGAQLQLSGTDAANFECRLPTGEAIDVPQSVAVRSGGEPDLVISRIVATGRSLLGTRYKWGGKTSQGIDCSGLVQVAHAAAGLNLPRDSNQQVILGQLTGTRWYRAGMRRGDTLYFIGPLGRVRHTAIYLGEDRFLQAVSPVVTISSFNPDHAEYDPIRTRSFAFAKRLAR